MVLMETLNEHVSDDCKERVKAKIMKAIPLTKEDGQVPEEDQIEDKFESTLNKYMGFWLQKRISQAKENMNIEI